MPQILNYIISLIKTNSMKKKISTLLTVFAVMIGITVSAQVTTNGGSGLAPAYPDLASAITALNGAAISSSVIITLNGNETAPAGGYSITASGSATFSITIQGTGSTITASAAQPVGNLNDAIFKIIGGDYITIQNFTMQENALNTVTTSGSNTMTEWGVALLYTSATDGAQNNMIVNNTISLNRTYQNSFGVYSNVRHTPTSVTTTADITAASGANSFNKVYKNNISNVNYGIVFIGCGSTTTGLMDNGNDIGGNSAATGNTITNAGGIGVAPSGYVALTGNNYLIFSNNEYNDNISYNSITSAAGTSVTITMGGILKNYSTGTTAQPTGTITTNINNNTVTITDAPTTGGVIGVNNQGLSPALSTATVNMNNNSVLNCSITGATATSASITGITNLSLPGILNLNNNIVSGNTSTATTGSFTGISNTGAVVTTCNINNNQVGTASANPITFGATSTTAAIVGISSSGAGAGCALSISNNIIRGVSSLHTAAATGAFQAIVSSGTVLSEAINSNNFNNITVNTSNSTIGFLIAASNNTPTVTLDGNVITTQFSNTTATGGANYIAVACNGGTPATGSSTITNNNFSNITYRTTTNFGSVMYWLDGNVAGSTHNITVNNNTFSNIANVGTATTATNIGILVGYGNANVISNNTFSNITGNAQVTGLQTNNASLNATGGFTVNNNNVFNLSSTGASSVTAISCIAGPVENTFKNKVYDINNTGTGLVVGISQSNATVGATSNIYNNLIGRLYAPASGFYQAVRGISLNSTVANTNNVYYNTIYLDGTNSGNSYCAYMGNATPTYDFRNNIFINNATASSTLEQMVYFRTGTLTSTYAGTSNNNILYCGTPGALNIIYADGAAGALTNVQQTLAAFQTYVGPGREGLSKTENTTFFNTTTGSSSVFLHVNATIPTVADNGAVNVPGFTDDFDGTIRQGNPGYTGIGTAPDIGADEFDFGTIPVTLLDFTAHRTGKVNVINWSTSQEMNSSHFVIERSVDGRNFTAITQVAAAGNSSSTRRYTYTDNSPVQGINYYRLKTVDRDNSSKYSWIRSVRNEGVADVSVYPNPVKDVLTVSISADKAGKGNMMITDVNGKVVYSKTISVSQGNNNLPVNLDNLSAGAYLIKVQLSDDVVVKKFNKL